MIVHQNCRCVVLARLPEFKFSQRQQDLLYQMQCRFEAKLQLKTLPKEHIWVPTKSEWIGMNLL